MKILSKKSRLIFCCLIGFGFLGCNQYNTPEGVLGTAYQALQEDDLKLFNSTLRDEALQNHGNEESLCHFQRLLLGKDAKIGEAKLIKTVLNPCKKPKRKEYSISILGKNSNDPSDSFLPLVGTEVICTISYRPRLRHTSPNNCHAPMTRSTHCQISKLE